MHAGDVSPMHVDSSDDDGDERPLFVKLGLQRYLRKLIRVDMGLPDVKFQSSALAALTEAAEAYLLNWMRSRASERTTLLRHSACRGATLAWMLVWKRSPAAMVLPRYVALIIARMVHDSRENTAVWEEVF